MSKKKNTLEDLDAFLKQQAATLVTPDTFTNKIETPSESKAAEVVLPEVPHTSRSEDLKFILSKTDPTFRKKLYDFIIQSLEAQSESLPEDKMLINTALYLKSGGDWKNVIRAYWNSR